MKFNTKMLYLAVLCTGITTISFAQYKLQTFGKVQNLGKTEKATDFKTTFPLKATVYVQLTYPDVSEVYNIYAYLIKEDGTEKLTNTTAINHFKISSAKPIISFHSLGMVYDAGNYVVRAEKESDKSVFAESKFTVTGEPAASSTAPAPVAVIFCDDTDDNFNPIKPVTSINKGDGVNFLAKLKNGIGAKFFIWAVFTIKEDGDEVLWKDMQENVANETYKWFATTSKTYFTVPGKYAVYMLKQNATNSGMTIRKPTEFYARGVIEVK